ncbi:hypothetical protein ES703_49461 [subsurface metagenome]
MKPRSLFPYWSALLKPASMRYPLYIKHMLFRLRVKEDYVMFPCESPRAFSRSRIAPYNFISEVSRTKYLVQHQL